jgi:hypothetical protein
VLRSWHEVRQVASFTVFQRSRGTWCCSPSRFRRARCPRSRSPRYSSPAFGPVPATGPRYSTQVDGAAARVAGGRGRRLCPCAGQPGQLGGSRRQLQGPPHNTLARSERGGYGSEGFGCGYGSEGFGCAFSPPDGMRGHPAARVTGRTRWWRGPGVGRVARGSRRFCARRAGRGADLPRVDLAEGHDWRVCTALLSLHAMANEARAGLGSATERAAAGARYRARARGCWPRRDLARIAPRLPWVGHRRPESDRAATGVDAARTRSSSPIRVPNVSGSAPAAAPESPRPGRSPPRWPTSAAARPDTSIGSSSGCAAGRHELVNLCARSARFGRRPKVVATPARRWPATDAVRPVGVDLRNADGLADSG